MFDILLNLFFPFLGSFKSESFPPVLSKKEEKLYLDKMKDGDMLSRNKLIEHNLRLVAHIIKKYDNTLEDKDDLLSIGTMGLIKAVDTYKHPSETKLATYAARCIENEILMCLRSNKKKRNDTWLFSPIGYDKEGNEISLIDVLKDDKVNVEKQLLSEEDNNCLYKCLHVLDEREFDIITKRYGLFHQEVQTQRKIAKELTISRSYVSRIEKRALIKLFLAFKEMKHI